MGPILTVNNRAGQAIYFGRKTLVPFTQVWHLKLPLAKGGLIWNRPISVVIQEADQPEQIVPVQDVTRQAFWLLFGMSLAGAFLAFLTNHIQRRKQNRKVESQEEE